MDTRKNHVETLLVIVTGLLVIYLFKHNIYIVYSAIALAALGIFFPIVAEWVHKGWMLLAKVLGWINSRILLSILFYVFLTPLAFFSKLFGNNALQLKRKQGESYYTERNQLYKPEDLEKLW